MGQEPQRPRQTSNAYNLFILVLTLLSLIIMVVQLLPLPQEVLRLLQFYDNMICVIFLIDFFLNLRAAGRQYFVHERGWLDLIGSIPTFGISRYSGLLRLARLSRLARITRLMRTQDKKEVIDDIIEHRSQYAVFVTIFLTILILTTASVLVLIFEYPSPDANIKTGWDSFWYSVVTITTVGYGDYYPVTIAGRFTGMFIMFAGIGLIGSLASILASVLVGSGSSSDHKEEPEAEPAAPSVAAAASPSVAPDASLEQQLKAIERELLALHQKLDKLAAESAKR